MILQFFVEIQGDICIECFNKKFLYVCNLQNQEKSQKEVPSLGTYISWMYNPWGVQNHFWLNAENSSQWDNIQKPFFGGDFTS